RFGFFYWALRRPAAAGQARSAARTSVPPKSPANGPVATSQLENKPCRRHGLCYIANDLQHVKFTLHRLGKPALAALLVGLVLLLNAMAVVPALHELIHKDADEH